MRSLKPPLPKRSRNISIVNSQTESYRKPFSSFSKLRLTKAQVSLIFKSKKPTSSPQDRKSIFARISKERCPFLQERRNFNSRLHCLSKTEEHLTETIKKLEKRTKDGKAIYIFKLKKIHQKQKEKKECIIILRKLLKNKPTVTLPGIRSAKNFSFY